MYKIQKHMVKIKNLKYQINKKNSNKLFYNILMLKNDNTTFRDNKFTIERTTGQTSKMHAISRLIIIGTNVFVDIRICVYHYYIIKHITRIFFRGCFNFMFKYSSGELHTLSVVVINGIYK